MYGGPNQFNMLQSARMGNDESTPADSFQGGIEDLESALMETNGFEMDELMPRRQQEGQNDQDQMLMMMMQLFGGGM